MASKIEQLLNEINQLTVLELAEFSKALETAWGVSGAMAVAAAPAAASEEAAPKAQEKSEFKVELIDSGSDKIKVIKALRAVKSSIGLGDAKKMVEETPAVIEEAASKEDAKKIQEALEAAGAKVKLS